jgi:putative hydrolase of the HAD superfamily
MDIKAVCFDIDGTMYPKWMTNVFLIPTLFQSISLMYGVQKFRKYMRNGDNVSIEPANQEGFRKRQLTFLLEREGIEVSSESLEMMEKRLDRQFYKRMERTFTHIVPYRSLQRTLTHLKERDLVIGALSDFPIGKKLETLKVDHIVDCSACTEQSGYLKPHIAPFVFLGDMVGIPLSQILYIGDSYAKDIVGGHNAGMQTGLLLRKGRGKNSRERYPLADIIFSDYEDLEKQLNVLIK